MTAFAFILGCSRSGSPPAPAASPAILGTAVIGGMLAATLSRSSSFPVTFAVVEGMTHRFNTRGARKETREPVTSGDAL